MSRLTQILLCLSITVALLILPPSASALTVSKNVVQMSAEDFFHTGVKKLQSQKYREAVEDFTFLLQVDANSAAALSNRCLAYVQLAEYQSAVRDCTAAINLNSNYTETFLNRGLAYYRQGNYQDAIADFNRVIQLKPSDFRAYYNRGLAASELRNYRDALTDYDRTLSLISLPDNSLLAEVYNDRGTVRLILEDEQGAIADFSQAVRLNSNNYRAYFNRACAYQRSFNYTAAIQDLNIALKLNPTRAQAYANRGIALYHLGQEREALRDLQKAAKNFLLLKQTNAYQQTLDLIKQLIEEDPVFV